MSPVRILPQEDAEIGRQGIFIFNRVLPDTVERCSGPLWSFKEQMERYNKTRPGEDLPITLYKTWDHTISPYKDHVECMHTHAMTSYNITMGEAQFLQKDPRYRDLSPPTVVGHLTVRHCRNGTRCRVEIMEVMTDIEVERLDHHCAILTGPTVDGYHAMFFLRGEVNCLMIAFLFSMNMDLSIKSYVHMYRNDKTESSQPLGHISEDGGLLVTRDSWYMYEEDGQALYDQAQLAVRSWASESSLTTRAWLYNLCDPWDPIRKVRLCPAKNIAFNRPFGHLSAFLTRDCAQEKQYIREMSRIMRYNSDNPWLGSLYLSLPSAHHGREVGNRVTLLVKAYNRFAYFTQDYTWALSNDPCATDIIQAKLHLTIHRKSGLLGMFSLSEDLKSSPVNHSHSIKFLPRVPKPGAPHPSSQWAISRSEQRSKDWANPAVHGKHHLNLEGSDDDVSILSVPSVVSRSAFQDVSSNVLIQQGPRPEFKASNRSKTRGRNQEDPSLPNKWSRPSRSRSDWRGQRHENREDEGSQKGKSPQKDTDVQSKASDKTSDQGIPAEASWPNDILPGQHNRHSASSLIPDLPEYMVRPMTEDEIKNVMRNVPNPGLYPIEELVDPVTPFNLLSNSLQMNSMYLFMQGMTGNMQRMQREICSAHRRISEGDSGRGRRPNMGRRPASTVPVHVDNLEWARPNMDNSWGTTPRGNQTLSPDHWNENTWAGAAAANLEITSSHSSVKDVPTQTVGNDSARPITEDATMTG